MAPGWLEAEVPLHSVFHRSLWADYATTKEALAKYRRQQETKARKRFEGLGFEVMVTSELLLW